MTGLSNRHGCTTYLHHVGRNAWAHKIVGRKSDVETVRYLFAWLSVEIERLAGLHKGNGRAWLNSYRIGCVAGCLEAMKTAEKIERTAVSSTALMRIDARATEAKEALSKAVPNLGKGRGYGGSINSGDGYSAGRRDGASIHQGARLSGGASRALTSGK